MFTVSVSHKPEWAFSKENGEGKAVIPSCNLPDLTKAVVCSFSA